MPLAEEDHEDRHMSHRIDEEVEAGSHPVYRVQDYVEGTGHHSTDDGQGAIVLGIYQEACNLVAEDGGHSHLLEDHIGHGVGFEIDMDHVELSLCLLVSKRKIRH